MALQTRGVTNSVLFEIMLDYITIFLPLNTMSDVSFLEFDSKGLLDCGAPFGLANLLARPLSRSPVLLLLPVCATPQPRDWSIGTRHSASQPQQDYAAAGAFVCVSCLTCFQVKYTCNRVSCVLLRSLCEMHHARHHLVPSL